jgi:hypothetical protein
LEKGSDKRSRGKIIVRLDNVNISNDELTMKLSAKLEPFSTLCCGGINNPYFVISRALDANRLDDFVIVYKSNSLMNNANPMWNPIKVKVV